MPCFSKNIKTIQIMKDSSKNQATLKDNVVLITGALTGIGRATAFAFAQEGANIVVSGRKTTEGGQLAEALKALGVAAIFIKADVRYENEIKALIDATVAHFG